MVAIKKRVVSLDVFRGLTIAGMILVNILSFYPDTPETLGHSPWIGLTIADLVFPFFLFIVGVSMTYSFASRSKMSSKKMWGHFIFRVVALYLIGVGLGFGLFVYGIPDFYNIRIPGVLQLIALSSLFAAPLARSKTRWIILAAVILLTIQSFILLGVSAPGVSAGSLDIDNNIAGWVDSVVFGSSHLLDDGFDPEGLIAVINGTALVLLGLVFGRTIRLSKDNWKSVQLLLGSGIAAVAIGILISPALPIIKQLWTASFILVNAGLATIILASLYAYIDLLGKGKIFNLAIPFGRNALIIYILSLVVGVLIFLPRYYLPWGGYIDIDDTTIPILSQFLGPAGGTVAFGLIVIAFWWLVAYIMDKKKIYIKL
jgi:predicted acyltransferase